MIEAPGETCVKSLCFPTLEGMEMALRLFTWIFLISASLFFLGLFRWFFERCEDPSSVTDYETKKVHEID